MGRKHSVPLPSLTLTITILLATCLPSVLASPQQFLPAETATPTLGRLRAAKPVHALLARETGGCISGTFSCASEGSSFSGVCCASGQTCAMDADNSPACCPSGAVCTGTAPSSYRAPSSTPVSYVANSYFSFPYIATSYSNAAACSKAASQCSANYAACTANLEGGGGAGGAVTVVVPAGNGGTSTIGAGAGAGTTLPIASATSVCHSLSSVACHTIENSYCTAGSTAGFTVGSANAAPTHMPCMGVVAGVAVGVGLGVMGI